MNKLPLLLLITILSFAAIGQQKEVKSFSLKEAVDYGKKYNQTLQNARMDQELAQQQINEIRAIGLPQVSATGRFTYTPQIPLIGVANTSGLFGPQPFIEFPQGIEYSVNGTLNATQLLFDGSFLMGLKAAREFSMLSKYGVKKAEYDVENDIIKAYCMVLVTEESIKLTEANISTIEKTRNDLEATNKAGLIERTDFDRIDLAYSNLLILRKQLSDARLISYYGLKLQMGMTVRDSINITDDLAKLNEIANSEPEIAANTDFTKRPEYQILNQQLRMHTLDKKRYQYGYAPSLAAFATHQQNAFDTKFSGVWSPFRPGTFVGINVSLPIFDGLDKHSKIQKANINIKKTELIKTQLENAIEIEVFNAKTTYYRSKDQLSLLEKNMKLADDIYKRTNIKYQNGLSSSLDVITTEKDLKESQKNYLNGIYDLLVARANLKKALGQ